MSFVRCTSSWRFAASALAAAATQFVLAQHGLPGPGANPSIAAASKEAEQAIRKFAVPPGFKVDLFAAEPLLANPVAFSIDEHGRFYVVETFRLHEGVLDIRGIMDWLDEDLACRTPDDRLAMMKRHLGDSIGTFTKQSDKIRLIEDRDGDGRADFSSIYAEGFTNILDGLGAGVLARNGEVWYTDIPNLWHLKDTNADGVADFRETLQSGYGVRVGFLGHDLHGLTFGPDGKLYFSIGDRGSAVRQDGRMIGATESGCVFRCNPDGSELEVFASGLRNPQKLAFDAYGNLFTGDNNSDSGDRARWTYLVEGGDSGWRIGYQFMEGSYTRGAFNAEKLWYPAFPGQAAYIVPPIANIADGPSGVAYYPGTGLTTNYNGHFFLVDFRGAGGISGIHSFAVKPKGAGFTLVDAAHFVWGALATDVGFGPDGNVYFSDWVDGWELTGKGRIYRVHNAASEQDPAVAETRRLLGEGMGKRSLSELARLIGHRDMRVRQAAQFALAEHGSVAVKTLVGAARQSGDTLPRIHAIWALGQIARQAAPRHSPNRETPDALNPLVALASDSDAEVRAQVAKVLGDVRYAPAGDSLLRLMSDASPRVRFYAALGAGKLLRRDAVPAVLGMLKENAEADPFLRHAGVMALTWIGDLDGLLAASSDSSASVRMGVLLALRRLQRAEISRFLSDPEPSLVLEAARAINDQPIYGVEAELAALIKRPLKDEALLRRVLNANRRHGTAATAAALADFSARSDAPETMRIEALRMLGEWPHPSGRDPIIGCWRPIADTRDRAIPANAMRTVLAALLQKSPEDVRLAATRTVGDLAIREAGPLLAPLVADREAPGELRAAALRALASWHDDHLSEALKAAENDSNERLRMEVLRVSASLQPAEATGLLSTVLEKGSIRERQHAFDVLASVPGEGADKILNQWLDHLLSGQVPPELQLDLLDAAEHHDSPSVKQKIERYHDSLAKNDPLAEYRVALQGGDSRAGRRIFFQRADVACVRCHKVDKQGGDVGPELTGIGTRQNRQYILESILFPNAQIAAGFETTVATLKNDDMVVGILKSEDANQLVLNTVDNGPVTIKKSDLESRARGLSAMPEGLGVALNKKDLRDLVEFLGSSR